MHESEFMAQLIVMVKRLNKRRMLPVSFPDHDNIVGEVKEGFSFEGEEVPLIDIPNPSLGKWYKDRDGHFYWGGGVRRFRESREQLNYQDQFPSIPSEWLQTQGRNIKVAVLDSGFFLDHVDLVHLKSSALVKDFGGNNNTLDKKGHGTHVLGLLAAKSNGNGVTGLIPEARFFLYKVMRDEVGFLDFFAEAAILDAIQNKVNIINMSFNVPSKDNSPFHIAIKKAIENNIIIVSSAGEDDNLIQSSLVAPARYEGIISVGEASTGFSQALHTSFNDQLDFIMPFVTQKSCWINDSLGQYNDLKGSSMATAFITGILASIMSFKNNNSSPVSELKNISPKFSSSVFDDLSLKVIKP